MRTAIAIAVSALALAAGGAARAASLDIRDAVARVTVIPEDRADIKVEFLTQNPRLPLEVRTEGSDVVVDGGLSHRIRSCHSNPNRPHAWVRGVGDVQAEAMPQVIVHAPRAVTVTSNGAVFGAIGRAGSVQLRDSGCSAWTVADVQGEVALDESGEGSVRMGSVGRLDVHLSGAANIHAVRVRDGMSAHLSGIGGLRVEDFGGAMDARVSGVGHVRVAEGRASSVRALVSGMGGLDFGGSADSLEADISGIGSVHVRQVTGEVTKSVSGIGHVSIDERRS